MKKKYILIMVALILLLGGLYYYKRNFYDEKQASKERYFLQIPIGSNKKVQNLSDELDKDIYSDKIITDDIKKIEYNFYDDNKSITGEVYLDDNGYLYITDSNSNNKYKVTTNKYRTLYVKEDIDYSGIYVYMISNDNKLYYMNLNSNNIKNAKVTEIQKKYKTLNFVDISFIEDISPCPSTLFVLADDGNIYDINSDLRYDKNIKVLYNNILVFDDNTIADIYGELLHDKDGNNYKIKYAYEIKENEYYDPDSIVIITENNKAIFYDYDPYYVYEYNDNVVEVSYDNDNIFSDGKLTIKFEKNYTMTFDAHCSRLYCPN